MDGSLGGTIATMVMSLAMLALRRAGQMSELPPERITAQLLDAADAPGGQRTRDVVAALLHFLFGIAGGALFGVLQRALRPRTALPVEIQGLVFAGLVWLVSYMGWIPLLGLMPPATRDEPRRPGAMVLAHGLYGAVLGVIVERRSR